MIAPNDPYPLILGAYLLSFFIPLFFFVRSAASSESQDANFRLIAIWSVVCLIIMVILLGLPNHWNVFSLIGSLSSLLIGNFLVFAVSGWAIVFGKRRDSTKPQQVVVGFVAGFLMIAPAWVVGVTIGCALGIDCL